MSEIKLHRALGFWESFATAVGLVVAGTTMVSLGNGFGLGGMAFMIPAFIALIVSILIAFSYAELANMMPGAGMIGDYTAPALGRLAAIFGVLGGYIVLVAAAGAMESVVAGLSLNDLWGVPVKPFAFALLALFCIVNLLGVKFFGRVQLIITVVMMATLTIFGVVGLLDIGGGTRLTDVAFNPNGWGNLSSLLAIGIWLYIGIEYVCPMSEEIKNPQRTIPKAMVTGLIAIFIADMLYGAATLLYVDHEELAVSAIPHLLGAEGIAGRTGLIWITIATVFASASSIDSHLAAVPRMLYGLSREGMLPKAFSYLHPRFRTPWVGIFAVLVCLAVPVTLSISIDLIMTLILVACITWLLTYIMAQVDVIVLRRRYPNVPRSFKTPGYPVPQIIGIAAAVYMIATIHPDPAMKYKIWLGALGVSAVVLAYGIIWLKAKGMPLFTPVPLEAELEMIRQRSEDVISDGGASRDSEV
ncbi:MAG: APC family permease [Actinobacteria bacterium]|nr:APC family permease [Actinomycetota bacterium]